MPGYKVNGEPCQPPSMLSFPMIHLVCPELALDAHGSFGQRPCLEPSCPGFLEPTRWF